MARGRYRSDFSEAIAALARKREGVGATYQELSNQTGIGIATVRAIFRSGMAFPRQVVALRMALRTLEKNRRAAERLFRREDET